VGFYWLSLQEKWLGMALFSSPHLLLRCKRPSLWPAGTEGCGFHEGVAVQTTTRAAAMSVGLLFERCVLTKNPIPSSSAEDTKKRKKQINITQRTQRSQRKEFYFKKQKNTLRPLWALANAVSPAKQVERDRQGVK